MVGMRLVFDVPPEWVRRINQITERSGNSRASWLRDAAREKLDRDTAAGSTLAEVSGDQPS